MSGELVRKADAAQYEREPIPEEQRGQIRVRMLNVTPDPLGSVAALCAQYEGRVIRDLAEVTDEERRAALDDMTKTVLNGPLEAVQFHFQIEGLTRSITHQMVRARASFFAQESLRFAVPEGDWAEEVPLPPSLAGAREARTKHFEGIGQDDGRFLIPEPPPIVMMLDEWEDIMIRLEQGYARLIELGMPAEEARDTLPHGMPTRIHMVCDLRQLLAEAGKRTCTQAQFPWRMIFAGIANALREHATKLSVFSSNPRWVEQQRDYGWQFREIANRIRPVCYQTGSCGFMAKFDRSCSIRQRVDANAQIGRSAGEWGKEYDVVEGNPIVSGFGPQSVVRDEHNRPVFIGAINDAEWALNPAAARS